MTADVRGYVDQVLAETNLGYLNSGVPVRVAKFCLEQATVNDTSGTLALLNSFQVGLTFSILTSFGLPEELKECLSLSVQLRFSDSSAAL